MDQQYPPNTPSVSLNQTLALLERFIAAWKAQKSPPEINDFLEHDSDQNQPLLHELIKIDLEYRYRVYNFPKRLDDYLAELPLTGRASLPAELIHEEYYFRQQSGLQMDADEYFKAYPEQAAELGELLNKIPADDFTFLDSSPNESAWKDLEIGQQIDDFILLDELGRGSFARVFKARQISMQRIVALKVSHTSSSEPQTLAQLDHPYLVRVYDQRILAQEGLHLMYMEYAPGGTLKNLISLAQQTPNATLDSEVLQQSVSQTLHSRNELLSEYSIETLAWPETVCSIGAKLATALDYAHRQGTLHLDIKPANVLLSANGNPKLADFNISFNRETAIYLAGKQTGGSLAYMSPEQLLVSHPGVALDVHSLDEKSDIYSLGITLTELLSLQRPFAAQPKGHDFSDLIEILVKERANPPSIETKLPGTKELPKILRSCLDYEVDKRPSAAQLARRLTLCLKPGAYKLIYSEPSVLKPAVAAMILLFSALLPNLLAAWFNYDYNSSEIIVRWPETSRELFWTIQGVINLLAFPTGIGLFMWLSGPLIRWTKTRYSGANKLAVQQLRKRCIDLGHLAALINIFLWTSAGIAYPLALHFSAGSMPLADYPHFFVSLLLCGVITSAYPFFLISAFCMRNIYPKLLLDSSNSRDEAKHLTAVQRRAYIYLGLGALVPLLTILALVLIDTQSKTSLVLLCASSLLGLGLIIALFRRIQGDVADLRAAIETLFPGR